MNEFPTKTLLGADNSKRIERLRCSRKGRRCWIIGNGTTLKKAPLRLLAELGEETFAVNRIATIYPRTTWRPTFYSNMLRDTVGIGQNIDYAIDMLRGVKECKLAFLAHWLAPFVGLPKHVVWLTDNRYFGPGNRQENGFSLDLLAGVNKMRSLIVPIQIATYMGYDPIYLVGVDGVFEKSHAKNHMTPDYTSFANSNEPWDWQLENAAQKMMHSLVQRSIDNVYNATEGGASLGYPEADAFEVLKKPRGGSLW